MLAISFSLRDSRHFRFYFNHLKLLCILRVSDQFSVSHRELYGSKVRKTRVPLRYFLSEKEFLQEFQV